MKGTRKIVAVLAIVAILLGSAVGAPASVRAESEPAVSIAHFNLAFGNQVYILYAVRIENADVEGLSPFMQFWTAEPSDYDNTAPASVSSVFDYRTLEDSTDGEKFFVFVYTDLTARQMADVIYARAAVEVNGQTYYSEPRSYSICEYAAKKLGIVPGVEGTDDQNLRALLLSMLDYGTKAQLYTGYRTDCLADQFYLTFQNLGKASAYLEYSIGADGNATVSGYDGDEATVVIASVDPNTGKPVTSIGAEAFRGNSSIETVIIPSTVREIGTSAFASCSSLRTVTLYPGLESVGDSAFSECTSLVSMTLPDGVRTLGNKVFEGCPEMSLSLPVSLEKLGTNVFSDYSSITFRGTKSQWTALISGTTSWLGANFVISVWFSDGTEGRYVG